MKYYQIDNLNEPVKSFEGKDMRDGQSVEPWTPRTFIRFALLRMGGEFERADKAYDLARRLDEVKDKKFLKLDRDEYELVMKALQQQSQQRVVEFMAPLRQCLVEKSE